MSDQIDKSLDEKRNAFFTKTKGIDESNPVSQAKLEAELASQGLIQEEIVAPITDEVETEETSNEPEVVEHVTAKHVATDEANSEDAESVEGVTTEAKQVKKTDADEGISPSAQKRFNQLTAQLKALEHQNAKLLQKEREAQQPKIPELTPEQLALLPEQQRYHYYMMKQQEQVQAQQAQHQIQQELYHNAQQGFNARMGEAVKAIPDFQEVVTSAQYPLSYDAQVAEHANRYILDSEVGPELLYHFAKNPNEAFRMHNLNTQQIDRELIKLEAKLIARKELAMMKSASAPTAKTVAPTPRVTAPTASPKSKDPNKMSAKEYMAWRKGQK